MWAWYQSIMSWCVISSPSGLILLLDPLLGDELLRENLPLAVQELPLARRAVSRSDRETTFSRFIRILTCVSSKWPLTLS